MARFPAPQKALACGAIARLTGPPQRCGMGQTSEAWQALVIMLEGANGRQGQRSCRDLAEHDRRDGEGVQLLRQPGDGVAGILQGDESGRRRHGGRAKAARRADGEISRQHEPAEPGADGRHGRALQSIEGQLNEIKAMLHQVHHNSLAPEGGYGAPRPPRTKRPPSEGEQK